jgi:ABC-2 type transport system permease protein
MTGTDAVAMPSPWRIAVGRAGIELKIFFRQKEVVAFIFALPALLLVLLGSIFGGQAAAHGVTVGQMFTAGMIAAGIMSASLSNLGISVATEREGGLLKRLAGTPMSAAAWFAGKAIQVLVCVLGETVVLIVVGMIFYQLRLPSAPGRWWTFAWVLVLSTVSCSLLGMALSSVPRNAASAAPVVMLPFTVLQFMSGVYVPINVVPRWMLDVGSFFPLKWMAQGLSSVFEPDGAAVLWPAHAWEHGRTALVLGAWTVGGLALCLKTFRWQPRS